MIGARFINRFSEKKSFGRWVHFGSKNGFPHNFGSIVKKNFPMKEVNR